MIPVKVRFAQESAHCRAFQGDTSSSEQLSELLWDLTSGCPLSPHLRAPCFGPVCFQPVFLQISPFGPNYPPGPSHAPPLLRFPGVAGVQVSCFSEPWQRQSWSPVSMGTLAGASVLPTSSISSLKSKPSKCAGTGLSWRLSHEGPQGSTERPSQKANRKGKSPEFWRFDCWCDLRLKSLPIRQVREWDETGGLCPV